MNTHILPLSQDLFDLDLTLSCGQIFGWKKTGDMWSGVHKGSIVSLIQNDEGIVYSGISESALFRFLGLHDDMKKIHSSIEEHIFSYRNGPDKFFSTQYELSKRLRILRQDPWECLVSFICSANSNVRTIGKRINLILDRHGTSCGKGKCKFPDPCVLASCSEQELRDCLAGYRAPYLIKTAKYISTHPDFLPSIAQMSYLDAKRALMVLSGVGPKVADCVLLFAFERLEAVPIDIRIRSIIEHQYAPIIKFQKTGRYSYDDLSLFCQEYFGPYAGYAQQFLFATRDF